MKQRRDLPVREKIISTVISRIFRLRGNAEQMKIRMDWYVRTFIKALKMTPISDSFIESVVFKINN